MIRWLAPVRARPSCLVILAALSLLVPSGASAGANVSPAVWDALGARGEARVLINLADEPGAPREREERLRRARTSVLSALSSQDLRVRRTYARVPAIAGTLSRRGLARLTAQASVISIQLDERGRALTAESGPAIHAPQARAFYGVTGAHVRVAVIDTGVDATNPELSGHIVLEKCFTDNDCQPGGTATGDVATDLDGHGTNVSGIITATGILVPPGIAPGAEIVAVRVFDKNLVGHVSDWVAALDWVLQNNATLTVKVVNLSLGTDTLYAGNCDADQPALASAVAQLRASGVLVFAASGNEGSSTSMCAPACNGATIAVGATYDSDLGRQPESGTYGCGCADETTSVSTVACFTDTDAQLGLWAPGAKISTAGINRTLSTMSGTSQASPHAAAVATLMLELDPTISADEIESTMKATGTPLKDPRNGLSFPFLDAQAALDSVQATVCQRRKTGDACDDHDACTSSDLCQAGACVGTAKTCPAAAGCKAAGACNRQTGACDVPDQPDGFACEDGDACTVADTCKSGSCIPGAPKTCPGETACALAATCDPATGDCAAAAKADGLACDDGDACTLVDTCQAGECVGASAKACPQGTACTPLVCQSATGECLATVRPDGEACALTGCAQEGTCVGGECKCGSATVVTTSGCGCAQAGAAPPFVLLALAWLRIVLRRRLDAPRRSVG